MIKELNWNANTTEILEENIREKNLHHIGFGNEFLDMTSSSYHTKGIGNKRKK